MAAITLDELLKETDIRTEKLSERASNEHIREIAKFLTSWRKVATYLGLDGNDLDAIEQEERDEHMKKIKALQKWKGKFGFKATYRKLVEVLLSLAMADVAEGICHLLKENNPVRVRVTNSSTANGTNAGSTDVLSRRPSFQQLSPSEQEELKAILKEDVRKMQYRFGSLVTKTRDSVEERISVVKFAGSILALGAFDPALEQDRPLLDEHKEEIKRAESISEVFFVLNTYWNYLNFEILEYTVELYGTFDDKERLKSYNKELQEFCKRRIFELPLPQSGNGNGSVLSPRQAEFNVKLDVREDIKCEDALRIRRRIAGILLVNPAAFVIVRVGTGCVQLTFLIPKFVARAIFPLSDEQTSALYKDASVIRLECEDYVSESETSTGDQSKAEGLEDNGLHHLRLRQQSRTKADQQLRVVKEGDELLGASYSPSTSTGKDAQQETAICLSTPHTVRNGLQLKLYGRDLPFASFTYALSPLTDELAQVDWRLLVTEDVECLNVRCHELHAGDNLPLLIAGFQKTHAVAVVLINTSDNYILQPLFLTETQVGNFPVLLLTKGDGMALMKKVEQYKGKVLAQITVETPQWMVKEPIHNGSDKIVFKEPGIAQIIKQVFTGEKYQFVDLTASLKKVMFTGGHPVIVSEDSVTFALVMFVFTQYEKYAKPGSSDTDVNDALKNINRHLVHTFPQDFPFYLVLAYKMHKKFDVYKSDKWKEFIKSCIEKTESMDSQQVASTFLGFLQRGDFTVQFDRTKPSSVFQLLQKACFHMARISYKEAKPSQHHLHPRFVYSRFMWVSLRLRLHVECGIRTENTANTWHKEVIKVIAHLPIDRRIVAEVKKGLDFGQQVNLPSNHPLLLANLFASEGCLRLFRDLSMLESCFSQEDDFIAFVTQIRSGYEIWLKDAVHSKFKAVSITGTLVGTLQEGLTFVDTLYQFWTEHKFNPHMLDFECKTWVILLLQLVDVTGDDPCTYLNMFLSKSTRTVVVKKYQDEIMHYIIRQTYAKFSRLTVKQFLPLFKSFVIWHHKFLEDYLRQYKVPSGVRVSDGTWKELFSEVVKRFSGAQHHHYLLDFLKSVAERYHQDDRAVDLVVDLLRLEVPKMFAVEGGGEKDEVMRHEFSQFLKNYIFRCKLNYTILKEMQNILGAITDQRDEFQQLVLVVVEEVVSDFGAPQEESVSSCPMYSVLQLVVTTLCKDLSWLQALSVKQQFCWGIVTSCCGKIPITKEHFLWTYLYNSTITCLAGIYNSYCRWKGKTRHLFSAEGYPQDIALNPSDTMRKYFVWMHQVQNVLLKWHEKFKKQQVNYDEILFYANHQIKVENVCQVICASSSIGTVEDTQSMKDMFLSAFEKLNVLLIKYIPGQPDTKWCTLLSLLQDWGVALPPHLLDLISQHVVFPGEEKAQELLETPLTPSTTGKFQPPGQDISLRLTKAFTLHNLCELVEGLEMFLQPVLDVLDMLVFFKLYPSKMFDKYLQFYLKKESEEKEQCSESEVWEQHNTATLPVSLHSPVLTLPSVSMKPHPDDQSSVQGLPLDVLQRAMICTRDLIVKLMQGTAAYSDIIAEGKLNLEKLNIRQQLSTLRSFVVHLKLPVDTYEGLAGVRSMLELFQYIHYIQTIHSVCDQYQLQGCLRDPQLVELCQLVENLHPKESRAKLTPLEASTKMVRVKNILCLGSKASRSSLELFTAVKDSTAFYQFVCEKQFVGEKGQAVFQQQYQLITAQLQHDEYNETVLNHLYAAFKIIEPFMDQDQSFHQLMSQVIRLDVINGLKQLKTVNTNITLIQLWFSRAEGNTIENIAKELDCIIATGKYLFLTPEDGSSEAELILEYNPFHRFFPPSSFLNLRPSSLEESKAVVSMERWNSEKISDFVRELGFLDREKESGDKIKHFLHINETAHKLLDLSVHLRKLGHPQYITLTDIELTLCATNREEADKQVYETKKLLTRWEQHMTELRNQYKWLLFFSMQKLLRLYHLLEEENPNLEALVHEISFLCSNTQEAWESALKMVKEFLGTCHKNTQSGKAHMHVVGEFLEVVFNNHSLPKRSGDGLSQPWSNSQLSFSPEPTQLHSCWRQTQAQLIQLIVRIYDGVPEAFEVFRCHPSSTKEELRLFLDRVAKHPLQYLILEVNLLPFKLQEYLYSLIWKRKVEMSSKASCIHLVETAPSSLSGMPWVKEHTESGSSLNFEKAHKVRLLQVVKDFACVQLIYGRAGDGKTHYIMQQLTHTPASLTIAVNEAFTPLKAISKLRTLPPNQKNCAIFFNFTMLPPGESVAENERVHHQQLMEAIGWFFFDLLMLSYVEDSDTGLSFRIPGGRAWAIYVEVPSHDHNTMPEESLKHFQEEVPVLGLLGTPHYIHPDTPYTVDEEVQLVCKYLKALQVGGKKGIDRLCKEFHDRPVKFSSQPDLPEEECQELLLQYMPEHVRNTKITQRLFIKHMSRRCGFLDSLPAFNFNMGEGEHVIDEQGKKVPTDTRQLVSTLMTTMLREVEDFCDPAIKENWSLKPHQQLIYDFKNGGASLGLISLHPEKLSEEDKMKFKKIGVKIPSMGKLYSRELLDEYLSCALNVELEDGRLTPIDDSAYVLTLDYTIKLLNIHERYKCGVPVIIQGETGVGKTALLKILSKLWNHALVLEWKRQYRHLLDFMKMKLKDISTEVSDNYQECLQTVEALSASQPITEEDLVLLCQLPDSIHGHWQFYSVLRSFLLSMRSNPVVTLLMLQESQQQEVSLEELFERAEVEDSAESTGRLLYRILSTQIKPTFHKLNVHAAMTPADIWSYLQPVFTQARKLSGAFENTAADTSTLRAPFVTVFLDEVNTSSCLGLFKEIIVDRSFDGKPIPDNVFIVAACNPHRGNSLASHCQKETWVRGSYYVRQLHPTLHFLMWDYGSLDKNQEEKYIIAKMKIPNKLNAKLASLTDLIVTSQNLMRDYAFNQLRSGGMDEHEAKLSARSCVSQRDIQRVFTFYQWVIDSYTRYKPYGEQQDYSRRAVLVALGIVYYMRLDSQYRKKYEEDLDKQLPNEVSFSQAFSDELDLYIKHVELPPGIAKTQALKENLFATIICTVTHTPLVIVGTPGSSKTLSFNVAIANLRGQESKMRYFRDITVFHSLDPHFYQCSRWTTSNDIERVFSRALNRQRSHTKFKLPIYCVVFMDEAGLPEESHESLKVLHYHLDKQEVSFVAITNYILDAAKTNRAVSLFRPETSEEDLKTLAKGCLCTTPDNPPPELKKDLEMIVEFCPAYSDLMTKQEFSHFFGLRDFIHLVSYLRRHRDQMLTPQLVMKALERNFNGSNKFDIICNTFLNNVQSSVNQVQCRGTLEVLHDSLQDQDMAEVRYKLIIDPSEDDSLVRLLFSFGVLQRKETHTFMCSNFPGDSKQKNINTIAAICHSAAEGHTVLMTQTNDIHESFYDLFNQRFRKIDDPEKGTRYYTNIAIGAHSKPCRVDPNFQCVVVIKKSEVKNTPAPFLNRFEKYCITHHSLLEEALSHLPPCIRIIVEAAMEKVQDFIDHITNHASFYGFRPETLPSLVLSLLPPQMHNYELLKDSSVIDSGLDIKVLLIQELVWNLRCCAGFHISPYSIDELQLDTHCLFDLVLRDPEFEGLLPNLSQSAAMQVVAEAMRVLHSAPAPQDGATQLSPEGCMVVALLQQWLVRYLCKRLMQLMTSEAFILRRNMLPSSYIENYLSFQAHFNLKKLILKYHRALEHSGWNPASSPTKLLCFTRSSSLIQQLPSQYPPSSVLDVEDAEAVRDVQQTLRDLVFPDPSQLVVFKFSSLLSQRSIQELLEGFVQCDKDQGVCLLVVNMQETSCQVVNYLRIMIEEAEILSTRQTKLFVLLLHFPPTQFFDHCYPSLFLKGWDHYYLDTVAHSAGKGVIDIQNWLRWCCFPMEDQLPPEKDFLVLALKGILPEAIPILSSRMFFGSNTEGSFNRPMNGFQRSEALRELLFKKGVGKVLCERFRSYWKPAVMVEYLEKVASFTKYHESMLNITDSVQTVFKSLFFDFLVYLLSWINEEFNIDVLFYADCTPAVQELFLDILRVFPLPKLSQLSVLSTSLPAPAPNHSPRFPFFKLVCGAVERIVEQSHEDTNVRLDLLQEGEAASDDSSSFRVHDAMYSMLQQVVRGRISEKLATPKESLVLAVEAMRLHFDLWQRYFDDFLLYKLRLGGLRGGAISQQILRAFFGQLHQQETLVRVVSLHCYIHVYHLELAKMANILRSLNQIQQIAKAVPMDREVLVSAVHIPCTPEHIATFVVNTFFNVIVGSTFTQDTSVTIVSEKMTIWFKAYRDVMTLSELKQQVYVSLDPQRSEGGGGGRGMEVVEARLNVMQAVFLAIQTSLSLREDILLKGQQVFQTLFNRYFTEALEVRCPRLAEVVDVISETSFSLSLHRDSCSVRLLMEGLFAHFFSPYRRGYDTKDVQWFLELANNQEQWGANSLERSVMVSALSGDLLESAQRQHKPPAPRNEVPRGAISMCVFKLYLGRILGTCDQRVDDIAALSGPLLLYHYQPRHQVGSVLMATPDLGPPAPYIPTFYQECAPITPKANHQNSRMQQPLVHLYFLTVLEHLQAEAHKLSSLVHTANTINQQCASPTTGEVEGVLLWVELQAVVQVVLQELAAHLDSSETRHMKEIQHLAGYINRLLDDVKMGGGDSQGHGMVLALHMVKRLKSSRKFSEVLTKKYNSIWCGLHCLQTFHEQLTGSLETKPHLLPFMLPGREGTKLGALYQRVSRAMMGVHEGSEKVEILVHIAEECMHSVQIRRGSIPHPPTESAARGSTVDKRLCFRMMVWLCAYYEFYDKKVTSQLLCNVMGTKLATYLREERYIRLIQCFLNPQLMLCHPESPNPLHEDTPVLELVPRGGHRTLERRGKKVDPLYQLFIPTNPQQMDQSDVDLRHSLANLVGVVLGCPSHSNHLWSHLFEPGELHGTYMTGFMYDAKINQDDLLYDCGVELTPEGQFGHQDYLKHATRGTYTLHSLYLLLWANFGAFCMSLLTQPEAEAAIHGPIISEWLSVRHYCVSQLRTMWMHLRNNLNLSDEERSFFVMRCTTRLYELVCEPYNSVLPPTKLLNTDVQDCLQSVFKTRKELDSYEQMWHTCIYQPSWTELRDKFAGYSQLWLNKLFIDIRRLELCYPHFPSERDFLHSLLSSEDIQSYAQGGELYLLVQFAQEWPRLQAGGLLLPDLVEFYQWLHTALAHLVTYERATVLPIGRVMELTVQRYSKEMGKHLQLLYGRVKDGYNRYVELAISAGACAALRQGNKIYTIADDIPLLHFLSVEEKEGNDWLYTVVEDIVAAHNSFLENFYTSIQAQRQARLARLLPDEPAKVYPSEVNDSSCIVGKFRSLHNINDFLQLVRSRYQPSFNNAPIEPHMSISAGLLQTMKAPEFQFSLLQEDIVACFLAGKPLICIKPSSLLRTPFKFRQSPADVVDVPLDMKDVAEKLPNTFKVPLEEPLQKRLEYEFHLANYHMLVEVVTALKTVAGHLIKALMEQSSSGDLVLQTAPQFMLMLYDHLNQSGEVLEEIGIRSTSPSQLACLVDLPLPSLFCCLQLFARWIKDGVYDFAALPFGVKTNLSFQDLQAVQQIPFKWTGSLGDLLEEIKQMNEVLKHSEAHITKIAIEAAHKPIIQYLQEIQILGAQGNLSGYIPSSILIQHYVSFRIALRRLALTVQQQIAKEGDTVKKQWKEVVEDLWDHQLPHLREEFYSDGAFVYDPQSGRHGFQEGSEYDSEEELMDDLMNEQEEEDHTPKGDAEENVGHGPDHHVASYDPQTGRYGFQKHLSMAKMLHSDTQTLEQSAREYTPERVGQFLEEIGLGQHAAAFNEEEISGEVLLEAMEEMLQELGVNSPIERLKIRVLFRRRLQGGVVQYPLQSVLNFLEQNKLDKYSTIFQESGMDGDLLLEADDTVLKELGVSSALDRTRIKTKYKKFINS